MTYIKAFFWVWSKLVFCFGAYMAVIHPQETLAFCAVFFAHRIWGTGNIAGKLDWKPLEEVMASKP